ncbi:MAG: flagellar biosynthetic protein FliR [Candidatus Aureabacteria bacterium]|nr:flagellar biosynthetic protein FliR [Candidatus Auribacterota bacterium]
MNYADIDTLFVNFICFMLILMRITGAFFLAPVFGSSRVLKRLKVWIAVFISFVILPTLINKTAITPDISFPIFVVYGIKEIIIGFIFGWFSNMPFQATRIGAEIAGRMSGFGIGRVINPDVDENVSLLTQYVYIIVVLLFLTFDGHHMIIKILSRSFEYIPLGKNAFSPKLTDIAIKFYSYVFNRGIAYGAPVLGLLIIISCGMGIANKAIPDLNVMMLAFPIRVFVGVAGTMFLFPFALILLKKVMFLTEKYSNALILHMSGGI